MGVRLLRLLLAVLPTSTAAANPQVPEDLPIVETDGRGDMLFGATSCGLVTWQLPQGTVTRTTAAQGLPSDRVRGVQLHPTLTELLVRTERGVARGWPRESWERLPPCGVDGAFLCALGTPRGWVLGGQRGLLVAWQRQNIETLTIPTNSDVVDLAWAPSWAARLAGNPVRSTGRQPHSTDKAASLFGTGLLAATDGDGLWLLRSVRPPRWLQLARRDGLPDDRLLHVVVDDSADAWVATYAGVARVSAQLHIESWPQDPLLSQRALTMRKGPSSHVYVGWWGGLFRIVTTPYDDASTRYEPSSRVGFPSVRCTAPTVELLPGIHDPIRSTAWASGLWWTSGDSLTSYLGATVRPPACPIPCGPGTGSRFQAAERGPLGAVFAGEDPPRRARPGGSSGSRESDVSGWRRTPLPSGASAMRSTSAAAGTLSAGPLCFVARRQGSHWRVRIPQMGAAMFQVHDVRGRFVGEWRSVGSGTFVSDPRMSSGPMRPGVYFVRDVLRERRQVRILVPR